VDSNLFLVATDEENTLRLYQADAPGAPLKEWDYDVFLGISGKAREADLEGAALVGRRVFWIGSHGRNAAGESSPNRKRFFATDLITTSSGVSISPAGKPCATLLEQMVVEPSLSTFRLANAARLAPKAKQGLNIEGLASTPEGHVLIGFRNPVPHDKALLVPLLNPSAVITGAHAQFGNPLLLDLEGLGIRDIARYEDTYIIIAGPYDGKGKFRIYLWKGPGSSPAEVPTSHLNRFNPEAIVLYPGLGLSPVQVLSDDGTQRSGDRRCKDIKDPTKRVFRSFWLLAGAS
jgi:hypothetical protein